MRADTVRERLVATIEARKLCWAKTDLEGVDQLTQEIDDLLDLMPLPRLPSDRDGHQPPTPLVAP